MTMQINKGKNLYQEAGVDIDKADHLVQWLQREQKKEKPSFQSPLGGFSAFFKPDFSAYQTPLLVSSTDGVGTKLLLALEHNKVQGLGFDLVAMCLNDLYTCGAKPLFFLDYYASGKLDTTTFKQVLNGIQKALACCECALVGGETAELPGIYQNKHFDLAGFVVGVVDEPSVLGVQRVQTGDQLYAFPSSGFHSNGYSLIRKLLKDQPSLVTTTLIDQLLQPTTIYYQIPSLLKCLPKNVLHALSHITGGGLSGNIIRILPKDTMAQIDYSQLRPPLWMKTFLNQFENHLLHFESIFNLGIGLVAAVSKNMTTQFEKACAKEHLDPFWIGHISHKSQDHKDVHFYNGSESMV